MEIGGGEEAFSLKRIICLGAQYIGLMALHMAVYCKMAFVQEF